MLQATEVMKLILGIGEPLNGRLLMFDALSTSFIELKLRRDPNCPVCSYLYKDSATEALAASSA